jgi:hypothetical protein
MSVVSTSFHKLYAPRYRGRPALVASPVTPAVRQNVRSEGIVQPQEDTTRQKPVIDIDAAEVEIHTRLEEVHPSAGFRAAAEVLIANARRSPADAVLSGELYTLLTCLRLRRWDEVLTPVELTGTARATAQNCLAFAERSHDEAAATILRTALGQEAVSQEVKAVHS